VTYWLKTVDQSLLATGWQDAAFVDPVSIVVVFALVRDTIDACCRQNVVANEGKNEDTLPCRFGKSKNKNKNKSSNWFLVNSKNNKNSKDVTELKSNTMTFEAVDDLRILIIACLYVSYAYVGSEISYPLKPFLFGINRRTRLIDDEGYRDELDDDEDDDDYEFPYDDDISYSDDDAYDCGFDDSIAVEWRHRFWNHCLATIERSSSSLLRLNSDSEFFTDVFDDLMAFRQSSSSSSKGTALMNGAWRRPNGTSYQCEIQNTAWTSLLRREM
jgi:Cyclin-dependent kinase 5 activator protein